MKITVKMVSELCFMKVKDGGTSEGTLKEAIIETTNRRKYLQIMCYGSRYERLPKTSKQNIIITLMFL